MSLHPIETTEYLRNTYERYLKTIYPFQDEAIRARFWKRLAEPERLVKGPLLEASPPFETGHSIEALVAEGVLHSSFRQLCDSTSHLNKPPLPRERALWVHQERAIRNVVEHGRNLVVATGTGSGKTEAFLIPILNALMDEEEAGTLSQPGVRALLLYPMNALANDQLLRLRVLLQNYPSITFGRYTGETLEQKDKAEERFLSTLNAGPLLENELLSREEMRETPPHLLLTNYAMLEYLLLRPQDTELFDGPTGRHWRFVVIDEAHVYDGASGIEVAMLLRRLKDRVVQSEPGRLTCIATSATIGKGEENFPDVAQFATNLLGEPFAADDVFAAVRKPVAALGDRWGEGSPSLYTALTAIPELTSAAVVDVATAHHIPDKVIQAVRRARSGQSALYALLKGDGNVQQLQRHLRKEPMLLTVVAHRLFPDESEVRAEEAAIKLVDLAVKARPDADSLPLLPARYHVFARALEGAFACLQSEAHADGQPRVYMNRHEDCPECGAQVFELATCARCGATYIVGGLTRERDPGSDQVRHVVRPLKGDYASGEGSVRVYYILSADLPDLNEDEMVDGEEETEDEWLLRRLCLQCGAVSDDGKLPCNCERASRVVRKAPFDGSEADKMYCPACSTRSRGVVYRLLTGKDAPVAVLASALYTRLPPADEYELNELPGQGRKLLMFADSRQDAAFFAAYLERTFDNILQRRLIFKALLEDSAAREGKLQLDSLAGSLLRQAEEAGLFEFHEDYRAREVKMQTWLLREMMSWGFRQSLERQGLLHFELRRPPGWRPPQPLLNAPWNLTREEIWALISLLLDTVRRQGVISAPGNVDVRDEFFEPRNRPYFISDYSLTDKKLKRRYAVLGWVPRRGSNSRVEFLEKVLARRRPELSDAERRRHAAGALKNLWHHHLLSPEGVWMKYKFFIPEHLGPAGTAYQLNYRNWLWVPSMEETTLYRCSRCRNVAYYNLDGACTTYGCEGTLEPIQGADMPGQNNHYRYLYHRLYPAALSVQEHTAQWRPEKAREVQNEFINGQINALSCSTTFELGVDVGALQGVLMRNVPPTTANYLQRAGRAGRRQDAAAFVLTFAQRRSHDLAYYRRPDKIVSGEVPTPTVAIHNPKIVQRHMHSVLIAAFLRWCVTEYGRFGKHSEMRVGPFFAPGDGVPSGPELLARYLAEPPEHVRAALRRVVPSGLQRELQVESWGWLPDLTAPDDSGLLDLAAAEVEQDEELYRRLEDEASAAGKHYRAGAYQKVLKTVRGRYLLNFLGQHSVLPKYGFPVDVVPLRTNHIAHEVARAVELDRDLRIAVSEYAPGGQIVAGKKVFTSGGLYKQRDKEWVTMQFAICPDCGRFNKQKGEAPLSQCKSCGKALPVNVPGKGGRMVLPEFGFVAQAGDKLPDPGEVRPVRLYSSRVYFDDYSIPEHLQGSEELEHSEEFLPVDALSGPDFQLGVRYSRYGQLAVVNHGPGGRGFEICHICGYGGAAPERPTGGRRRKRGSKAGHKRPDTGAECSGYTKVYRLGHQFITDVLEIQVEALGEIPVEIPEGKDLWRSVLYALLEGASAVLGIRRDDLNGTLYHRGQTPIPSLVLYDDVPGGAGHVERIQHELPDVLRAAVERIEACECGPETSCHECLWNYYNQPYHEELARGIAVEFLQRTLNQQ